MKNRIIFLGIMVAVMAIVSISKSHAQNKKELIASAKKAVQEGRVESVAIAGESPKQEEKKILYDTTTLEQSTFNKLQALEEQFRNLGDPKWIEQQKGIIKLQYETILQTVAETKKLDPMQMRYENGKLIVLRKEEKKK